MSVLFRSKLNDYKSNRYEFLRNLFKSRNTQRNRAKSLRRKMQTLRWEKEQLRRQLASAGMQLHAYRIATEEERTKAETDSDNAPNNSNPLLSEFPIFGHQFGATMIAMCINLVKTVGFRPAVRAMEVIFTAMRIPLRIPSHDSLRQWTSRIGVAELQDTFRKDQDTLWMADHSCQIGKEKVLLILGIELNHLPQPGETLCLDQLRVLAIVPGSKWKKEDVAREYQKLAKQIGAPRYLLCDGAVELRDPAKHLKKDGKPTIVLGDLKHHAANLLEKQIGRSEQFQKFLSQVGLTRNRTQQTELGRFAPPTLKQKSRFMNLGPLLNWAAMVLGHLANPDSQSQADITPERMQEKLGWLEDFRDDLKLWRACEKLIGEMLSFINYHGLSRGTNDSPGTSEQLRAYLGRSLSAGWSYHDSYHQLFSGLIKFVEESEQKLAQGERAWLSTEILESLFGRFKQLEGQHCKGGFTSLIAAIPILCRTVEASHIRQRLKEVSTKKLKVWVTESLGQTLTSKRNQAYKEVRKMNVQF